MDKSGVQRTVVALHDAGLAASGPRDACAWSLDAQALVVGRPVRQAACSDRARPHLEALASATGKPLTLWVVRGPSFVVVDSVESSQPLRIVIPVGLEAPLTTGPGVAAFLDEEARGHLGDAVPPEDELAAVRARGYYVTTGGAAGTIAMGAPVYAPGPGPGASAVGTLAGDRAGVAGGGGRTGGDGTAVAGGGGGGFGGEGGLGRKLWCACRERRGRTEALLRVRAAVPLLGP
ncbi:hypothetical protein ACU686_36760 [Yinghuangia aomiensis]